MVRKVIIVSVHVHYFSFFSLCQSGYVRLHQVTLGYIRFRQVKSVYVGGTGRGARQFSTFLLHFITKVGGHFEKGYYKARRFLPR